MSNYTEKTYQILVITYNHEKIILECLESIRNQISRFGKNKIIALTILDDCSTDKNVMVINDWLELNKSLFKNVDFKTNEKNIGLKRNMLLFRSLIKTDFYFMTAGDDRFLLRHSLFDYIDYCADKDIVFSPSFFLGEWNLRTFAISISLYFYKYFPNHFKKVLKEISPPIQTQGSYINRKLINNKQINRYILDSAWEAEDYPTWEYLFLVEGLFFDIYPFAIIDYWPNGIWRKTDEINSTEISYKIKQLFISSSYRIIVFKFIVSLLVMIRYPRRLLILLKYFVQLK